MQNKSVRIKTKIGDKNLMVNLDQNFDFLEILSLKISQQDLYRTFCADYGVLVGRVIANKGFGVPNAKISVFIPVTDEDEKDDLIEQLYPFKDITSKNSQGYRYNLLLSEATCELNTPVGTFPTKEDVLNSDIQLDIFEKYYKYTTRTNSAGDYILFGVPIGQHTIHIDIDLSDIGSISLRPYDLIEQGMPKELFSGYNRFKSSENLDELPQLKTQSKSANVVPFWGDQETCDWGITRTDFDTGIEIIPTSIFMGSIFSDVKKNSLNKRCNPKNDTGEQCELLTRGGTMDILRVTYDDAENPIGIENYNITGGNDVIDDAGAYAFNLPMYYDRLVTDEFGNLVPSLEPGVGIATKGKYRFKLKFNDPSLRKKFTTASLIVPSLHRYHGGTEGTEQQRWTTEIGQYDDVNQTNVGLEFGGDSGNPPQSIITPKTISSDLDLDFHTFEWKQVYTLSHFIKKYKRGGDRFSFLGIKGGNECDDKNYFPMSTAMKKASFLFSIISLIITIITFIFFLAIFLGNLRICSYVRFIGTDRCRQIANFQPFRFIIDFIPPIPLPCGDREYIIDPQCAGFDSCSCGGSAVETGSGTSGSPCCPNSSGGGCDTDACISFNLLAPNALNCPDLNQLQNWRCCAIYEAALTTKALKFTFFDAWLNGSAYLFQFKSKNKIKNNGKVKNKFCGPGSTNLGGDNYAGYSALSQFFLDIYGLGSYLENTCSEGQCLILGPSGNSSDRNYVGGDITGSPKIKVPLNTPGLPNGANDSGEYIYCNWMSSTKIVSLGRFEMCADTFSDIENCISTNSENTNGNTVFNCRINDLRLGDKINPYTGDNLGQLSPYQIPSSSPGINLPQVIKVGTGGENGFDRQETTKKFDESSFEDPKDVFIYLMRQESCKFKELFTKRGKPQCKEFELKTKYRAVVAEVAKEHNSIVSIPVQYTNANGALVWDIDNPPVWDVTGSFTNFDPDGVNGPFAVDSLLKDRYEPNEVVPSPQWTVTNQSIYSNPYIDVKTNMPYFYFGLVPGQSAINKYREKYLV